MPYLELPSLPVHEVADIELYHAVFGTVLLDDDDYDAVIAEFENRGVDTCTLYNDIDLHEVA